MISCAGFGTCNTGVEPIIQPDVPPLRRSRLGWVKQNYIRADTLTAANAKLVAAQNSIDLVKAWGGGEVASADGMRFVVPIRTVHAGPNPKYFGRERGVTYYNMTSDQYTGLNGVVVPGTLRDSLVLLSVVLEQETELKPTSARTRTADCKTQEDGEVHRALPPARICAGGGEQSPSLPRSRTPCSRSRAQ